MYLKCNIVEENFPDVLICVIDLTNKWHEVEVSSKLVYRCGENYFVELEKWFRQEFNTCVFFDGIQYWFTNANVTDNPFVAGECVCLKNFNSARQGEKYGFEKKNGSVELSCKFSNISKMYFFVPLTAFSNYFRVI